MSCKIISVTLNKGGVGKTTTCINLGSALSKQGYRVLLVDLDPQGHLASSLGHNPNSFQSTIANLLYATLDGFPADAHNVIVPVSDNLDLMPSNRKLTSVGERLTFAKSREQIDEDTIQSEFVLKSVLEAYRQRYDYIIIDCQPNVSILTRCALVAADSVILPMEPHYLSYEGLRETLDVITLIKRNFNPKLEIEGILITKYQSRTTLCRNIKETVESQYADSIRIFSEPIAHSIKAAEQSVNGTSIFEYDEKSSVALAYQSLAKEVCERG